MPNPTFATLLSFLQGQKPQAAAPDPSGQQPAPMPTPAPAPAPDPSAAPVDPGAQMGALQKLIQLYQSAKSDPQAGADQLNSMLPDQLSARPAILEDRKRKAQMLQMVDQSGQ